MRLIDGDKISGLGLTIAISERTGDVLKGHARGKEEIIRRAVDIFIHTLNEAPTIDPWHYPSKGEYPPNNKWVFVYLNDETCTVGLYCSWAELKWIDNYENEIYYRDIVAWQYIIPPKEEV